MSAADSATEIVADVAEEVAEQATDIAEVSRGLSGRDLGLVFGGLVVGAGLGGAVGYIFAQRRLEKIYSERAADEIAEMTEHYHRKTVALEGQAGKRDTVDKIVKDRGYTPDEEEEKTSAAPPMAVTPPAAVVTRAEEVADEDDGVEDEPDVEEEPEVEHRNVFQQHQDKPDDWDWHKERASRSPLKPYVIHVEERDEHDAYDGVIYTYYEQDDVVCNERDEVLSPEERERIIGEANLGKFGHGSNDPTSVYVRNDQLEMDMEINLSPNSYAEEVHGLEPEIKHSHRRRGRPSPEDE